MGGIKLVLVALVALSLAGNAAAQPAPADPPPVAEMERSVLEVAEQFMAIIRLMMTIKEYQVPEMLGNGDIIIRRRSPAPPVEDSELLPL